MNTDFSWKEMNKHDVYIVGLGFFVVVCGCFLGCCLFIEIVPHQVTVFNEGVQILLRSAGILVLLE